MASYQPDDVNDILRRASELQSRSQGTAGAGGLTPDDLQSLGAEIGIDPKFVAEALRQRARGASAPKAPGGGVFGGPARVVAERTLPSTLTDALWAEMVTEMRALDGQPGTQDIVGTTREWRYAVGVGSGHARAFLSATPSGNGETRVRAERSTINFGVPTFLLPLQLVFVVGLFASMGYGLPAFGASVLAFVLVFLAGRFAYGRHTQRAWQDLQQMLDRFELTALRESPAVIHTSTPSARLALPTDEAPGTETSGPTGTRTQA